MPDEHYCVYIMANPRHTVLYVGVTGNLPRRVFEHQQKLVDGFTKKYNCSHLVYYDQTGDVRSAIEREKELKGWTRNKKELLIQSMNPEWNDLSSTL